MSIINGLSNCNLASSSSQLSFQKWMWLLLLVVHICKIRKARSNRGHRTQCSVVWFCISHFCKSSRFSGYSMHTKLYTVYSMHTLLWVECHCIQSLMWCWIVYLLPWNIFNWKCLHLWPVFHQTRIFWADVPVPHHSAAAVGGHPPLFQTGEL